MMRFLLATMDGAGNLEPILGLIDALVARGHEIHVVAHDVQRARIEVSGGRFISYETAPQWDQGVPGWLGQFGDAGALVAAFGPKSAADLLGAARRLAPDAVLVDCMMPHALRAAKSQGLKTVALVHAPYSAWTVFLGGAFKGPIDEADLALGLSYRAFDVGADFPANLRFVGPARPAPGAATWTRRSPGKPLVLASLSSAIQGPPALQIDLLQRICNALGGLEVEAVVTTGRGIDPADIKVGANTTIARRIPHEVVLAQADLCVTHAGHGAVMAAVSHGVPMLCLPPGADQPVNAAKVAELGLGEVLPITAPVEAIRAAMARLLADGSLKVRSEDFAAAIKREPGIERAVELIEAL
jgi:UDP:flavonoid glycosyltransferase YjiC (YdhE family)